MWKCERNSAGSNREEWRTFENVAVFLLAAQIGRFVSASEYEIGLLEDITVSRVMDSGRT